MPVSPSTSSPASGSDDSHNSLDPDLLLKRSIFLGKRGRLAHAKNQIDQAIAAVHDTHTSVAPYLVQLASIHYAQGNLAEAEQVLRRAVQLKPTPKDALCGLAQVLNSQDAIHIPECLDLLRQAVKLNTKETTPSASHPECIQLASLLTDVGVRLKLAGLPANAILYYKEAVQVNPTNAHTMYNLAVAYADAADFQTAKRHYEDCLRLAPSHVEAWCNLGVLHRNDGRPDLAMEAYEKALSINPNFELAKRNLAVSLCERATTIKTTDRSAAKRMYKRSLALQPYLADTHYNMGVLYAESGKYERALMSYNLATHFNPRMTEAHNNLGVVHKELGNMEMALECYKKALQCDQQHHQTHNNIAILYTLRGNVEAATYHLRLATSISPQYAEAHNNLGVLLRDQGDIDSAISYYEKCVQLDPRADMAAQNRLHALSYSEKWTKAQVFEEHVKWGKAFQKRIDSEIKEAANGTHIDNPIASRLLCNVTNPPLPDPDLARGPGSERPLRIGYLSPDFFTHSVSYFAEVLVSKYDREGFEIYAYANVAQPDAKTERFRSMFGANWRNIWGLSASAAGKQIMGDGIDILVELAGHTANNRLDVMALRTAPVQVTWIGYPNTTGLKTIHYRVTDGTVDPVNTSQQFSEKLWRLPDVFLCYTPAADAPADVGLPPLESSGGIVTFGSFNVLPKTQARTLRLWASILRRVPTSRLLLKAKPFESNKAKKRMEDLFLLEGITADRLDLVPLLPSTRSHLEAYSNVDVGLDPFPYAGTTTTCEAMYMGVPVITMGTRPEHGDHAHNVGVTLMSTVGHPELVAYTDDDYIEKAVDLATDLRRLKEIRRNLRGKMMASPLGDGERFMRGVESMFCGMWRERGGKVSTFAMEDLLNESYGETSGSVAAEESVGSTNPQSGASSDVEERSDHSAEGSEAGNIEDIK